MPLELCKRKDRPSWYARGTVLGQEVYCSSRIPHHGKRKPSKEAERWLENLQQALYDTALQGDAESIGFEDAARAYMLGKSKNEQRYIERLITQFGDTAVSLIGQRDIDDAAKELYPDAQPQTRNRQVYTPAGAILHWAYHRGYCAWLHLKRPDGSAGFARDRHITPQEANRILSKAKEHEFRVLFTFLLYTGARITEALELRWDEVDLTVGHASLRQFKSKKKRPIPLRQEVVVALAHKNHREGHVFRWRTRGAVYPYWKEVMAAAEVEDFTPHDCRHTFATWARKYGKADLQKIMEMGGWDDIKSVQRYTHVTSDEIRPGFEKLPKLSQAKLNK